MALGHELGGIEFKGPGPMSNSRLVAQVVKAVLGMANRRDGGSVIIGVEDNQGTPIPTGLTPVDLSTWTNDALADQIARYADPSVTFDMEVKEYQGNQFVLIEVQGIRRYSRPVQAGVWYRAARWCLLCQTPEETRDHRNSHPGGYARLAGLGR